MRRALKLTAMVTLIAGLGLQAYILGLVFFELFARGNVGFASAIGYGASLPFSIFAYLVANTLIYGGNIKLPMKSVHLAYFGSHLLIITFVFAFAGRFGQ